MTTTAFETFFGVPEFDEKNEKLGVIDNLNYLKSLSVEEFTFRKKWEEIRYLLNENTKQNAGRIKGKIWTPTNLEDLEKTIRELTDLRPVIIPVEKSEDKEDWDIMRYFVSTAEYNQAPGRYIRYSIIDENTGKFLGISAIASDVISISDRDTYIGWTSDNRLKDKRLANSAIGTTIVPTQPFGYNFLGGKLIASLLSTKAVRDYWKETDKDGKDILVGLTTTSLYGSNSMYNGIPYWHKCGSSHGKIPIKPDKSYINYGMIG
jgi:hypothetical protein